MLPVAAAEQSGRISANIIARHDKIRASEIDHESIDRIARNDVASCCGCPTDDDSSVAARGNPDAIRDHCGPIAAEADEVPRDQRFVATAEHSDPRVIQVATGVPADDIPGTRHRTADRVAGCRSMQQDPIIDVTKSYQTRDIRTDVVTLNPVGAFCSAADRLHVGNLASRQCSVVNGHIVDQARKIGRVGQSRMRTAPAQDKRIVRLHRAANAGDNTRDFDAIDIQLQRAAGSSARQMMPARIQGGW